MRGVIGTPTSFARVSREDHPVWACVDGDRLHFLDAAPWAGGRPTGASEAAADCELLAPAEPTKIVCVGLNYRTHVAESDTVVPGGGETPAEPLLFLKPPSALLAPGRAIVLPRGVTRMDPEAE